MSIDRLRAHWGFSKTPFTKELAPSMLFGSSSHQQAVARISWVVQERALGVVCGEVGAGKTVAARAATAGLDPSRHTVIYLPNPVIGARGIHAEIVRALGDTPQVSHRAADRPSPGDARDRGGRARPSGCARPGRESSAHFRAARAAADADELADGFAGDVRVRAAGPARRCAGGCGKRRSPRWISGSRCATRSTGWTSRRPAITSRTI